MAFGWKKRAPQTCHIYIPTWIIKLKDFCKLTKKFFKPVGLLTGVENWRMNKTMKQYQPQCSPGGLPSQL